MYKIDLNNLFIIPNNYNGIMNSQAKLATIRQFIMERSKPTSECLNDLIVLKPVTPQKQNEQKNKK
jgi:hypothetical protein